MESQQHIVFMGYAATGHMNPTLPLVAELRARGCHVTYFVEATMRAVVESAGASWMPFRNPLDDGTGIPKALPAEGVAKYVPEGTPREEYADPPSRSAELYAVLLLMPALLQDLRALQPRPSLIVYDPFLAFAQVAAHVLGVPAAASVSWPGPGVMVQPDEAMDLWEAKPWVDGPRKEIIREYGVDVLEHGMLREFYSTTLNLVTTIDELFAPPCPGRQQERFGASPFKCVGLLADLKVERVDNSNVRQADAGPRLRLGELDEALASGRRVLYVSLGTVASSAFFWSRPFGQIGKSNGLQDCTGKQLTQHVFRACFEALGDSSNGAPLVVLSLGPQEDVLEGLPPVPPNFRAFRAVPQLEVLRRCSAFLTHCGANSMHEGLSFGVPMAAVPIFGDQPLNADSLAVRGAAIAFHRPMESVTPAGLAEAMGRLAQPDPEKNAFLAAARRLAGRLQATKGVPMAVDALLAASAPGAAPSRAARAGA